jgi:hypothetical protein
LKHLERTMAKAHCSGVGTALGSPTRARDAENGSVEGEVKFNRNHSADYSRLSFNIYDTHHQHLQ